MKQGLIFDIDRFSSHDGPGIRAAVFLKGCPISCQWCHSPESQSSRPELIYRSGRCTGCGKCAAICPERALIITGGKPVADTALCRMCFACAKACIPHALSICGEWHSADEVFGIVAQDKLFFDNSGGGVTVTGGEPLLQPEFTYDLLKLCKQEGIHTAIETSGFGDEKALHEIAGQCDMIFYDIKSLDSALHRRYTGAGNEAALHNLASLCGIPDLAAKITVRIPCIPGINDSIGQISEIARLAGQHGIRRAEALPYNASAGAKYEWLRRPYLPGGLAPGAPSYYDELNNIIKGILEG